MSNKKILITITVYKQKTIDKNLKLKLPKKKNSEKKQFSEKKKFFWIFFFKIMKFGLKQNHEMAGITNSEIMKCGDSLYINLAETKSRTA